MALLAVGDSITAGFSKLVAAGVPHHSYADWVALVTGEELTTRALPGGTSRAVREKYAGKPLDEYSLALVYVGVNNAMSWHNFRACDLAADLRALLEWIAPHAARIAVMTLPDDLGRAVAMLPPYGPRRRARIAYCNDLIRKVAPEFGATVVDAPTLRTPRSVIGDGVHPNSVGHRALADATLEALGMPSTAGADDRAIEGIGDYKGSKLRTALHVAFVRPLVATFSWARAGFPLRIDG